MCPNSKPAELGSVLFFKNLTGLGQWHNAGFRVCTNMSPGSAQHDPLHEAAQGGLGIRMVAHQGLLQKSPPHIAVVEGLICQELQQTLHTCDMAALMCMPLLLGLTCRIDEVMMILLVSVAIVIVTTVVMLQLIKRVQHSTA